MSISNRTSVISRVLPSRNTLLAFVAGVGVAIGASALAGSNMVSALHGGAMMGQRSPAEMQAHVDRMLKHFYVEINATDIQKAQLDPIVKQAFTELAPMHQQFHAAHQQLLALMSQNNIDRAALETFRQAQLQTVDQASKRLTQLLADVGDVLTPEQRKALAARIAQHHGGMMHG